MVVWGFPPYYCPVRSLEITSDDMAIGHAIGHRSLGSLTHADGVAVRLAKVVTFSGTDGPSFDSGGMMRG